MANRLEQYRSVVKGLSATRFLGFEDFNVGKLLANDLVIAGSIGRLKRSWLASLLPYFFHYKEYHFPENCLGKALIFNSSAYEHRKDYKETCRNFMRVIPDSLAAYESKSLPPKLNRRCLHDLRIRRKWRRALQQQDISKRETNILLRRLQECCCFLRYLQRYSERITEAACVIFQFDAIDCENLLSQYCQARGVPTATLQHGHFNRSWYMNQEEFSINAAFEGFVSNYFLAWGEYTRCEARESGIPDESILCVGTLKGGLDNEQGVDIQVSRIRSNQCMFAVVLSGGLQTAENDLLIDYAESIADRYGLGYVLRPHPDYDTAKSVDGLRGFKGYSRCGEGIDILSARVVFCLCGNSTVFSEWILYCNSPIFRIAPVKGMDIYQGLEDLVFSNHESLYDLVAEALDDDSELLNIMQNYKLRLFAPGDVFANYQHAIDFVISRRPILPERKTEC